MNSRRGSTWSPISVVNCSVVVSSVAFMPIAALSRLISIRRTRIWVCVSACRSRPSRNSVRMQKPELFGLPANN